MLIVGPPGAGKGTQAARISSAYGIPEISTGDIFRANIKNETPFGLQVKAIVDAGDYVPDSLTNQLVTDRLAEEDAKDGFLLDGYPRTLDQVRYLDELLASKGEELGAVIQLVADQDEIVARLTKRAQEQGRAGGAAHGVSLTLHSRAGVSARVSSHLGTLIFKDTALVLERTVRAGGGRG